MGYLVKRYILQSYAYTHIRNRPATSFQPVYGADLPCPPEPRPARYVAAAFRVRRRPAAGWVEGPAYGYGASF